MKTQHAKPVDGILQSMWSVGHNEISCDEITQLEYSWFLEYCSAHKSVSEYNLIYTMCVLNNIVIALPCMVWRGKVYGA